MYLWQQNFCQKISQFGPNCPVVFAIYITIPPQEDQDQVSDPGSSSQGDKGEIVCEEGEKNEFQTEKIRKLENLLTKCKVIY